MIVIHETERIYIIRTRTNRRLRWQYADYQGRWETPEKAIEVAKERVSGRFEYQIELMDGTVIKKGTA